MIESDFDPRINPLAAARWAAMPATVTPWLHGEVGRRMSERLDYIKLPTKDWINWSAKRGGNPEHRALKTHFWQRFQSQVFKQPANFSQDMIWSNMQLHMEASPERTLEAWYAALKTDGFVLFSLLGPDTLTELRAAYLRRGWPSPLHTLTDMHDWGDRLAQHGFAEPVMAMERLILTFNTPERALQELRELGRNLCPVSALADSASQGLRGRGWRRDLLAAIDECRNLQGDIALTFELIYGHAIKSKPSIKLASTASVSLSQMRSMLGKDIRAKPT